MTVMRKLFSAGRARLRGSRWSEGRDDGVILIIWTMALTALLGFVALALAAGDYVQSNGNTQNAADAAALAAATVVGQSSGPIAAAEQTAADEAETLAQSYDQVPTAQAPWQDCTTPTGFTAGDAAQTNCIAFAENSSSQTVVSSATPSVTISAPNVASGGEALLPTDVVATVKGVAGTTGAQGTIYFYVYGGSGATAPTSCVTDTDTIEPPWALVGSSTVTAGTQYYDLPVANYSFNNGDYWWEAYYDGTSTANQSVGSGCSTEKTVVSGSPTLSVSAPDAATAGVALGEGGDVVAQLSGTTGDVTGDTVTFYEAYDASLTAPPPACYSMDQTDWDQVGTPADVTGDVIYTPGGSFTPMQPGAYWWDAVFTPSTADTTNPPADSSCSTPEETVVSLADPSLALSAPSSSATGTALPKTGPSGPDVVAQLSGTTGVVTGDSISFYESGPSTTAPGCYTSSTNNQALWTLVGTAAVSGDGTYSPGANFTPTVAGDYWWDAVFTPSGGDTSNNPADSSCTSPVETVVGPVPTAPTLSLAVPNTGTAGAEIDPDAVVADLSGISGVAPTEPAPSITFWEAGPGAAAATCPGTGGAPGWTELGAVTVTTSGTYSLTSTGLTPAQVGNYDWYAAFSGYGTNSATGTGCGVIAWVEVPGQGLPTILGTTVNQGGSTSYAVYSQASGAGEAKLCYYPGNCANS